MKKKMNIGDDVVETLKKTILYDVDFLILIIDSNAIESDWVRQEFEWGLQKEKELGREFVLPIVLEKDAWAKLDNNKIKQRKYLHCYEFNDDDIKSTAIRFINELFAITSKELYGATKTSKHKSEIELLDEADEFMRSIGEKIRLLVYPYRENNTLDLIKLLEMLQEQNNLEDLTIFEFNTLLKRIINHGHLTGIVSDGENIWVKQEHHAWKTAIHSQRKMRVAKRAVKFIQSNSVIAIDSGSTTLAIATEINKGLELGMWDNLSIVTNSIPVAQELLKFSSKSGLSDKNHKLRVYMTEGRIRPSSLAVVNDEEMYQDNQSGFAETLSRLGSADLCFVGASGVYKNEGFAVHSKDEVRTKRDLLSNCKGDSYIVIDSSKLNVERKIMFVSFSDKLKIITNESSDDSIEIFDKATLDYNMEVIVV